MKDGRISAAEFDDLIEEITLDANGKDEQLWAFRQAFEDDIAVPCEASVIGQPVRIAKFDYDGNDRRGLTATCRSADGTKHIVAASEVLMPLETQGGLYLAAYRQWMGLSPVSSGARTVASKKTISATAAALNSAFEVAVLSIEKKGAYCRRLDGGQRLIFSGSRVRELVPGDIAVIRSTKTWMYGGLRVEGVIESTRFDVKALKLVPLQLQECGLWKPEEHFWGDLGQPVEDWARPIIARGPRPAFEMEQVLPGTDIDDPFSDPIIESLDRLASGDAAGARQMLMDLCAADLRCLDAYAHLGNMVFDTRPSVAVRYYEAGVRIGELSLPKSFDGLLPWGRIDNRPFLRCMSGYGLCLWRMGSVAKARGIFERMLWLNPSDNQGVRILLADIRAGRRWRPDD